MARKQCNPTNSNKPFPTALRTLMDERNTSQKDLADHLGKTRQAISLYCNGESAPDLEALVKIAHYFDTSTDYLLGISSDPDRHPCAANELGLSQECVSTLSLISRVRNSIETDANHEEISNAVQNLHNILVDNNFTRVFGANNPRSNQLLETTVFARLFPEFVETIVHAALQNGNIINDFDAIPTWGEIDLPTPNEGITLDALNHGYELIPIRDYARFKASEIGKAIERYLVERYIDGND